MNMEFDKKELTELSVNDLNDLPKEDTDSQILRLQQVIEDLKLRQKSSGYKRMFVPGTEYGIDRCPKHRAFFVATGTHTEVQFRAGVRTGKTTAGGTAVAAFLVQDYPDWWYEIGARVYKVPTNIWACGQTVQSTRDIVQKELMGALGQVGTGLIPPSHIQKIWSKPQTPGSIDTVEVYNMAGDICLLGFKSYDQKIETFVGTAKHCIWLDEEPPPDVYNECVYRTSTLSNYAGRGIVLNTVTPLKGVTDFLKNFDRKADHIGDAARIATDD